MVLSVKIVFHWSIQSSPPLTNCLSFQSRVDFMQLMVDSQIPDQTTADHNSQKGRGLRNKAVRSCV